MCLLRVKGPALKTTGLGWKVFRVTETGEIYPANRGREVYAYGRWYSARAYWSSNVLSSFHDNLEVEERTYPKITTYKNGFHIALRRSDARAFIKYVSTNDTDTYVIRQVQYRQAHTLGQGNPNYFGGPQVIADEIMIMAPRPGGTAYARKKAWEDANRLEGVGANFPPDAPTA